MKQAEFDKFADEYRTLHCNNIRASGESPEFFAEYKIADLAHLLHQYKATHAIRGLDFGAGVGNSIPFFNKYLPDAEIVNLDVSSASLDIAQDRFAGNFVCFNGKTIPFPENTFDFVFSACVFHHIPASDHPGLLGEIHRVLKSGGMFVVFEHNPYNPLTVQAVNTCPFDENAVLIAPRVLKNRVTRAGFVSTKHRYRIFFPNALRVLRPLEPLLVSVPLGAQYYVSACKQSTV